MDVVPLHLTDAQQGDQMKPHTIIAGPCIPSFDGPVARVIALPDGTGRIETWERGVGWVEAPKGSIALHSFVPGACRPVSPRDCARLGCSLGDLGPHWWEETASIADRAKLVRLIKTRAWDLACHHVPPGNA
jgi:hypothetical protein